mmetsp:Transcript_39831/g.80297  ORF Transcript_39831/g.80297 Transcript_39831/m.80297 type:complete len:378 (-) Transcript_39831:106-1239(-)
MERRHIVTDRALQHRRLGLRGRGRVCGGGGFLGVGLAVQDVHRHQRNLAVVLLGRPCLEAEVALLPGLRDHHRVVRRQHDRDQHRHRREPLGRAVVDGTVGAGAVDLVALGLRVQRREYLEGHEGGDEGAGHDAGGRHPLRRAEREHRQEQKQDEVEGGEEGVELAAALLCRVRRVLSEPEEHDDGHGDGEAEASDRDREDDQVPRPRQVVRPIVLDPGLVPLVDPLDEDHNLDEQEEHGRDERKPPEAEEEAAWDEEDDQVQDKPHGQLDWPQRGVQLEARIGEVGSSDGQQTQAKMEHSSCEAHTENECPAHASRRIVVLRASHVFAEDIATSQSLWTGVTKHPRCQDGHNGQCQIRDSRPARDQLLCGRLLTGL